MKAERKRFLNFIKNMRFRERMLLIYIVGGIIPFLVTIFYINNRTRDIMVEQTKKAQSEEITLLCNSVEETMKVAEDVSLHIVEDEKVRQIVSKVKQKDYVDRREFEEDCQGLDFIDDYLDNFKEEISFMRIYVENQTVIPDRYINYMDPEMKTENDWYQNAKDYAGEPFWTFLSMQYEKNIVLNRAVLNERGEAVGVLQVLLQMDRFKGRILRQSTKTMLLYGNSELVVSNFYSEKNLKFIYEKLNVAKKEKDSFLVEKDIKDYLVSFEKVYPSRTKEFYTVASFQDYQELITNNTKTGFISFLMAVAGMALSVFLIFIFSGIFGKRIKKLREQMHFVANGEYEAVEPIEGMDEVGQLYQELEQMTSDIKELTERVSEEKVQKEKLHTKQKEVEFKMLASQINPHFLYNTLETIRMKAKINQEKEIEELVNMLARIMRRNIQVEDKMVSLKSEIELLDNYLVIQKYRFGDRIRSEVIVEKDVNTECKVVPLIIQPFVENAYVHGLESKDENGLLKVHIFQKDRVIYIEVVDNGAGIDFYRLNEIRKWLKEGKGSEEGHIGVNNVNQRLKILYGDSFGVAIDSEKDKGTRITIRFPEVEEA